MMNNFETVGSVQISTAQSQFGGSSLSFNGTTSQLTAYATPNITFGTADFTIELWLRLNAVGSEYDFFDMRPTGTNGIYPLIYVATNNTVRWWINSTDVITSTATLSANTWYHISICRASGSTKLFINGTQSGSTYTDTNNYLCGQLSLGCSVNSLYFLNGYIDDFRITKGYARYTTNFTVPSATFPDK